MNISQILEERVSYALHLAGAPQDASAILKPSNRPDFGDYQANGVMGVAKSLKTNPKKLALKVLDYLELDGIARKVEVSGPGFINIYVSDHWLSTHIDQALKSEMCGVNKTGTPQTVVVDYSGPNLAKEMHVGHLRSTIIGDAVVRVLGFLGHKVIRQNHVGDWGTQFGMLIAHMISQPESDLEIKLSDLESFYREAKVRFDNEPEFAKNARDYVVKLQSGDEECLEYWQKFIDTSLSHCNDVYRKLGVLLTYNDVKPESSYNSDLPHVIKDLFAENLLTESQGAQCVFMDEFKGKGDKLLPTIVQKSDGGYLYATTDLAALRYRQRVLQADRILYFVDARQSLHFKQVFSIARAAKFVDKTTSLEHMPFGTMMGKDGKPFKTREGGTVKLIDLLNEANERAFNLVTQKNPKLDKTMRENIAFNVGIGAVKYADLSKNRTSDYIFNWDSMLSFEGNTSPYLQYAVARINSLFSKTNSYNSEAPIIITESSEHQLALKLLQFDDALNLVDEDGMPNTLCNYLYELAGNFMTFYEACPILKVDENMRDSRLKLAHLTANILKTGLGLLGIGTMERM